MPSKIIQNYLNDTSIDIDKRNSVYDQMGKGFDEKHMEYLLTERYGNKYGEVEKTTSSPRIPIPPQKTQGGPGLVGRLKNTFKKTGEAFVNAQAKSIDAFGEFKSARGESGVLQKRLKDLKKAFNEGQIDEAEYEEKKSKAMARKTEVAGKLGAGAAGVARSGAEALFSPATGAVTGAFEPELNKLGEKIADGFSSLDEEKQAKVRQAFTSIGEFAGNNPGLRDLAALALEVTGAGTAKRAANKVGKSTVKKIASDGIELVKDGVGQLKNLKVEKQFGKNLASAQEAVRPLPTIKNLREAAETGRAKLGEKNLFSGSKDFIELSPRMEQAAKTLANSFPDLKKASTILLPSRIKDKISSIAKPLQESFQKIPVPKNVKSRIDDSWQKLKKKQADDENFSLGVEQMQKKFENNYLAQITKRYKDANGKFRQANADDIWDIAKAYDNSISSKVKNITEASDARFVIQNEAWIQNRNILRGAMDDLAEASDNPIIKSAFREMSDLYEAQSQILKNVRPSNKSGTSVFMDLIKKHGVTGLGFVGGGAALKSILD